ncbi:hypothetical protein [Xanthomonas maliensis]|uniref:hypothetical protein n=1 Tax=Xanthomonas maliensis TaxID=1321368 RepID=UPI0003B60FC9|nr:hypothetical protein [Xanthomonas maliensis]KAB7772500.1 hypothetical protein CKY51_00335 [Xanthomonas maliensis]
MRRLLPLLLSLGCWPGLHAQEIRRCVSPEGLTVFTDRRCEDVGASTRLPPAPRPQGDPQGGATLSRYGCPRRLSELVSLLHGAIDNRDVNRLSSLYLWGGQSDAAANQVLGRLEGIAQRPLLDIAPLYPQDQGSDGLASESVDAAVAPVVSASARPRPWGLRLEQTLANGTPTRSVLRLRRQYNCFWVTF